MYYKKQVAHNAVRARGRYSLTVINYFDFHINLYSQIHSQNMDCLSLSNCSRAEISHKS